MTSRAVPERRGVKPSRSFDESTPVGMTMRLTSPKGGDVVASPNKKTQRRRFQRRASTGGNIIPPTPVEAKATAVTSSPTSHNGDYDEDDPPRSIFLPGTGQYFQEMSEYGYEDPDDESMKQQTHGRTLRRASLSKAGSQRSLASNSSDPIDRESSLEQLKDRFGNSNRKLKNKPRMVRRSSISSIQSIDEHSIQLGEPMTPQRSRSGEVSVDFLLMNSSTRSNNSLLHMSTATLQVANVITDARRKRDVKTDQLIESLVWFSFHLPRTVLEDMIAHELQVWLREHRTIGSRRGGRRSSGGSNSADSYSSDDDKGFSVLDGEFAENMMKLRKAKGGHDIIKLPKSVERESALLFVDMSGFTKLSTMLDVESLSKVINSYFDMIVGEVIQYGGDILKFAGDAFFAEWKVTEEDGGSRHGGNNPLAELGASLASMNDFAWDDDDVPKLSTCVLSATKCAIAIVEKYSDYHVATAMTNGNDAMLNVHCGIGVGNLVGLHVGDYKEGLEEDAVELRREFLFLGEPIEQVAKAEEHAQQGEVYASPEAVLALSYFCNLTDDQLSAKDPVLIASREQCFLRFDSAALNETSAPGGLQPYESLRLHCRSLNHGALARLHLQMALYVHPVIRGDELALSAAIQSGKISQPTETLESRHRAEAELRSVFTIFIKAIMSPRVTGMKEIDTGLYKTLSDIMHVTSRELDRYSGHLRQFIVDDKGVVLIATFGLRGSTFPNMVANNALPATFALHKALKSELKVENRIGATFGKVYCGVVGGLRRHEFAVMGAPVNLAARLMASKENQSILVDQAVKDHAGAGFIFKELPPVMAKGYDQPVPIFEPIQGVLSAKKKKSSFPFVGRQAEKKAITSLARNILNTSESPSSMVFLMGESGMGKSALALEVMDEIRLGTAAEKKVVVAARSSSTETDQRIPLSSYRQVFLNMIHYHCEHDGTMSVDEESDQRSFKSLVSSGESLVSLRSMRHLNFSRQSRRSFSKRRMDAPPSPEEADEGAALNEDKRHALLNSPACDAPDCKLETSERATGSERRQGNAQRSSSFRTPEPRTPDSSVPPRRHTYVRGTPSARDVSESSEFRDSDTTSSGFSASVKGIRSELSPRSSRRRFLPATLAQSTRGNMRSINEPHALTPRPMEAGEFSINESLHRGVKQTDSRNSTRASFRQPPKMQSVRHYNTRSSTRSVTARDRDDSSTEGSAAEKNLVSVPYFEKLCWVCEKLEYPYEYADIVGSQFLGLESANPVTHIDGHVPTMDELVEFLALAFICMADFADLSIILLDDFQWVDAFSWRILRVLCKRAKKILLICAARSHDKHAVRRMSTAVSQEHQSQTLEIALGPLDISEIKEVMASVLGCDKDAIPEGICTDIFQRSGGLPVFVVQLLENIKRKKTLELVDGVLIWTVEGLKEKGRIVGAVMEESFLSRLDMLDVGVRKVLQTCAVLGLTFALTDLLQVHPEMEEMAVENALDIAVDEMILVEQVEDNDEATMRSHSTTGDSDSQSHTNSHTRRSDDAAGLEDRFFQFSHAMWRNGVLTTMLKERKMQLHRIIAQSMESDTTLSLEQSDISRLLNLFEHWKSCADFQKAAPLALNVGARLEEWDLMAQSLELYEDALELSFDSVQHTDEDGGGSDDEWVQVKAKPVVLDLILRLHICIGLCHQRLGDNQESALFFEDAYNIIRSSSKIPGMSKALMMPIVSSLCALKLEEDANDPEVKKEQERLIHLFVTEARETGDPVDIARSLAMQATYEARLGCFDNALDCVDEILTIYKVEEHSYDMVAEYGSDFALVSYSDSVQWLYLIEKHDEAEKRADWIIDTFLPMIDLTDTDGMMAALFPILQVLVLLERAQDADWLLKKYVINPYHENSGHSELWAPLFNPLAYLLEIVLMEEAEQPEESFLLDLEKWLLDEDNMRFEVEMERKAHTLIGEACWRLAYFKEDDDPSRSELLEKARSLLEPIARYPHREIFLKQTAIALIEAL